MPLTLNVGLTKKIGQPDYGSLGASCHVEVELDSQLLQYDLDGFHQQVRKAFVACRQAVQDELAKAQTTTAQDKPKQAEPTNGHAKPAPASNSKAQRRATASQVRALNAIASRQALNLGLLLGERFQVNDPAQLSISAASQLIDELNQHSQPERKAA
jgi:hypothetical protein